MTATQSQIRDALNWWHNSPKEPWNSEYARIIDTILQSALDAGGDAWQPIETAPKDGGKFLATDGKEVEIVKWSIHRGRIGKCNGYSGMSLLVPTRWQPLPALTQPSTTGE